MALLWAIPMECRKGRFIMKFIFKIWCLEFFLGLIYIFYFRTTLYQLLATSLNSGRCGLFLNGRTRWLLIPHWQICMIIWNICLRWEFYILKLSFFKNITLFSVVWIEIETVLNRNPCSFCWVFLKMYRITPFVCILGEVNISYIFCFIFRDLCNDL